MQRRRRSGVLALLLSLVLTPVALVAPASSAAVPASQASVGRVAPAEVVVPTAQRQAKKFTPRPGVKFSHPLRKNKRKVMNHLVKSIDSVPRREKIRILSWNIRSDAFVNALIRAHNRGVSVRVLISLGNANPDNPNPSYNRLKKALKKGSKKRPPALRSWARKCDRSCRGERGIAHTKMFVFSKVGKARDVVMYSSANATEIAVNRQWNDIYTLTNRSRVYNDFIRMFKQMAKDKPAKPPYRKFVRGKFTSEFFPWRGKKAKGDPTLNVLNKIRCQGARNAGVNGRTHVRIAQTAILDKRGIAIAKRLKQMWDNGCNIRIVYALMGNRVLKEVRRPGGRGPIPIRQIAQDWEGDGVYDRYLHTKFMAVSGVYDGNRSANVTFNGTANWSGLTLKSDEVVGTIHGGKIRKKHAKWVDNLFGNPPPQSRTAGGAATLQLDGLPRQGADPLPVSVKHGGIEF